MRALVSFLALVLGTATVLSAECIVYRNSVTFDAKQVVNMMVSSGEDCRVHFPLNDKTLIDVNEILDHPRYGGVRVHGTSGAYYRSNPGYRGPDAFAFAFCRNDQGRQACAHVQVKVQVR